MNSIIARGILNIKAILRFIVSIILLVLAVLLGVKFTSPQPQGSAAAPVEVRTILVQSASGTTILEL